MKLNHVWRAARHALLLAFAFLLTSCATTPLPTASGNPEVTISSTNTKRVKEVLIAYYSSNGFAVVQDTQYTLAVSKTLDPGQAMLYQLGMGNAYSSAPQMVISFTLSPIAGATKVFGHVSVGMRGVFGQDQGMNLNRGRAGRELQTTLNQLKQWAEKGSSPRSQPTTTPAAANPPPATSPAADDSQ